MIDIIKIVPSPVTPESILEITINYNGEIFNGLIIKQDKNENK